MKEAPKELNAKAYAMTIKEDIKSMARWTAWSKINCGIKLKICGTIFLYSEEGWITITSTILLEMEPVYDQGQDSIVSNQRSYWQVKKGKILQ